MRFPTDSLAAIPGAALAVALALGLGGCGNETNAPAAPDCAGRRLVAFMSDRNRSPGVYDIYLYDLDAQGFRLLANLNDAAADASPSLTSEGRALAFQSVRSGRPDYDILIYDRCTTGFIDKPGLNTMGDESYPAFTGDGNRLVFARDTLGHSRIRLYDGTNNRLVPLPGLDTLATFNDWAPSADRTGNLIAFVSDRSGNPDIWVYDRSLPGVLDLPELRSDRNDLDPWITPSGRYVAFASDRVGGAGGLDVYLYDLQTTSFVTLVAGANSDSTDRNPTLSDAGDLIIFESNRAGGRGGLDLWSHYRPTGVTVQPPGLSSTAEDSQPYLVWP